MTSIKSAAATDPGQRPLNEDHYLLDDSSGLYIVADGVGGREAGEVASRLTCETIAAGHREGNQLTDAIRAAHAAVRATVDASRDSNASGMASTAVALHLHGNTFTLAWAGDSKAFLWSAGTLHGLTRDHSLVEQLVLRGEVDREEARDHPQKNVILSAVGGDRDGILVDENTGELAGEGIFILCSDGLSDVLSHEEISAIAGADNGLDEKAQQLTLAAKHAGGRDNITTLLVAFSTGMSDKPGHDTASKSAVYERYDAAGKELTWPLDKQLRNPSVQRVRGRKAGENTGASLPVPVAAEKTSMKRAASAASRGARTLAVVLLAAMAVAGVLYFVSSGAVQGN